MSFWLCGVSASSIANKWRMRYLERLLVQDMTFFDNAEPGSLTMMLSDSAMAIQSGLSEKFVQALQGFMQFIFGFAIAFYFEPILTLVLLTCVPFLGLITTAMFMWGSGTSQESTAVPNQYTTKYSSLSHLRTCWTTQVMACLAKRPTKQPAQSPMKP